jgi:hypothetical protein
VAKDQEFCMQVESAVRRRETAPAVHERGPGPEGLTYHA